jgi:pyruvate kinase
MKTILQEVRTKIIATIGPATSSKAALRKLIKSGMSVARLNFSHGSHKDHAMVVRNIRDVSEELQNPVAILLDLSGPKIRLGEIKKPLPVSLGESITLGVKDDKQFDLFTGFSDLINIVGKGERILIDDGYIELKVKEKLKDHLICKVVVPGIIKSRKGINLPDIKVRMPVFTDKDKKDLLFGLKLGIDFIAMSFVDSADNLKPLQDILREKKQNLPVIAKIERPVALKNIKKILDAFSGIMIARGDLGVEVEPERVPIIQKDLIRLANQNNKLVITATQMLESMINNPRPTRAEASDVSNAILDGTDLIMLSGETSVGKYPDKAVSMMVKIGKNTENSQLYKFNREYHKTKISNTEAIVRSASDISADLGAKCIIVYSMTGNTALLLSKYRPRCSVYAFTPYKKAIFKMSSYWGIQPNLIDFTPHTDEMLLSGENFLKKHKLITKGDLVIIIAGITRTRGATNMLQISVID